jgi:acetolactate synthase I/II/III large subunit
MADGLARVTDRPGVCLVTSGPGATNLMTGVAAAYVAHSPVVVLVGGIALDHYQKDAFQEYDLLSMFRPVTKHAVLINKPERIPELLRGALRTAMSSRPGPVFVEIPRDVLGGKLPPVSALAPESYRVTHPQPPHAAAVREAVQRLRRAERPLLLVGGVATRAGANELVTQLSERCAIPMITAYGRNDAVPSAHPLYLGPLGRAGAPEAAAACRRADLILAVGSRLAQFTSQFDDRYVRPGTAIIQIDIEGRDIGRYYPVAVGIQADARETVQALLGALDQDGGPEERAAWRREAETLRAQRLARLAAEADLGTKPMKPQRVYAELRRVLPPETIVALDAERRARVRVRPSAVRAAPHVPHAARPGRARLRVSGGARRQARPAGGSGDRRARGRRLPDELPGDRDRRPTPYRRRHDRHEQQLLGIGEGVPEALLREPLHRLRHREPAL